MIFLLGVVTMALTGKSIEAPVVNDLISHLVFVEELFELHPGIEVEVLCKLFLYVFIKVLGKPVGIEKSP